MTGAKVLAEPIEGVGPLTALALTSWLGGKDRFSSSRKAVRFAGPDITVYSSHAKRSPGRLSRQGPPVLRWAAYEAGKAHARVTAPDHAYYAAVKDSKNSKRAALSEARKIIRQACHILAELGNDAFAAALTAPVTAAAARHLGQARATAELTDGGTTAASSLGPLSAEARPATAGPPGRPDQTERPHPPQAGDTQSIIMSRDAKPAPRGPR